VATAARPVRIDRLITSAAIVATSETAPAQAPIVSGGREPVS
jgi:hypothetical protein